MADALISFLLETLASEAYKAIKEKAGLVRGVKKETKKLSSTFINISAVLDNAEKRRLSDGAVGTWLEDLKDVSFDIDDVLDTWLTFIAKKKTKRGLSLSCLSLCVCSSGGVFDELLTRYRIAHEIRDLNESLDVIEKEKDKFNFERATRDVGEQGENPNPRKITTSLINENETFGRDEEKKDLIGKLLSANGSTERDRRGFKIVSLVGVGGHGKTTLAQLVYNDDRVINHFDCRIWVYVSESFEEIRIARIILEGLGGNTQNSSGELNSLVEQIKRLVQGKKFLLVLDDVWNENCDKWEEIEKSLINGDEGSRIMVTTQKINVCTTMKVAKCDTIELMKLCNKDCWKIFYQNAFFDWKEEECKKFEEIGQKIVEKSDGSPLLAKTLGGLMSSKKTLKEWEDVYNSELWKMEHVKKMFAPFLLSYYDLKPSEKRCLLYCSIFPKGDTIKTDKLIRMWMSQGFFGCKLNLEEEGDECLKTLKRRCFFHELAYLEYKMHGVVCDFLKFLTGNEYWVVGNLDSKNEENERGGRLRHLTMNAPKKIDIEGILKYKESKLRTLFFPRSNFIAKDPNSSLIVGHTRIRTLISQGCLSVPSNIGEMIHLRYLDLSSSYCQELPDSICDLYNLQTLDLSHMKVKKLPENINKLKNLRYLDVSYCQMMTTLPDSICDLPKLKKLLLRQCCRLERLPVGFKKLVELRHLDIAFCSGLVQIPKEIVSLPKLCVLDMDFHISKGAEAYYLNLEDLKSMKLTSSNALGFYGCTNLRDVEEAENIGIKGMKHITYLRIGFNEIEENQRLPEKEGIKDHESKILEALEPQKSLEGLTIEFYMGSTISPKWMMSLENLNELILNGCPHCLFLPPLGKLPSLKVLSISGFNRLETVGYEFLGFGNEDASGKRDTGETSSFTSFPKLRTLSFRDLSRWESWIGPRSSTIMPCLLQLDLVHCSRLKALPKFLSLATTEFNILPATQAIMPQRSLVNDGENVEET